MIELSGFATRKGREERERDSVERAGMRILKLLSPSFFFFTAAQERDPTEARQGGPGATGPAAADAGVGPGRPRDVRPLALDARLAADGREHAQPAGEQDGQVRTQHVARVPA